MAQTSLANTAKRQQFFQGQIIAIISYWQGWLAEQPQTLSTLEPEQGNILRAISFALDIDPAWPIVYKAIISFAPFMERRGEWETWETFLLQAIKTAQRLNDTVKAAGLSVSLGLIFQRQGHYKQAVYHYRNALRISQSDVSLESGRAYANLGYLFTEQGRWHRAEVFCCQALRIFNQLNSPYSAHAHNHLGLLYTRQNRWELAHQHLSQACQIWQAENNSAGLMRGYLNLGLLYIQKEDGVLALGYLNQALDKTKQHGDRTLRGQILANSGIAWRLQKSFTQAEVHLKQAEAIFNKDGNYLELARTWHSLGMVYYQQGEPDKALAFMQKALRVWEQLGNICDRIDTLMDVITCELARKNTPQAISALTEIERLMEANPAASQYAYLYPQLSTYRKQLAV